MRPHRSLGHGKKCAFGSSRATPHLQADKLNVDESKAQEITAYLRPNPTFTLSADGTQIAPEKGVWRPFAGTFESPGISYLHERQHKRELRLESAKKGTLIAESSHADLERTLLFNLRSAFVSTLQAKAVLQLAKDDLAYYDHVLDISRDRFKPVTSRKSISTGWNCSACSMSRTCKPPKSICARRKFSCSRC